MSLKVQLAVISLMLAASQAPAYAASAPVADQVQRRACYDEARWPVEAQPGYVYGSARVREQLRNGFNPHVHAMNDLCFAMAKADADKVALAQACGDQIASQMKAYGDKATTHARRLRDICQAMTGQQIG